ncbi:MAG: DUF3106 domain-containing protein [Phycisphaerae bacterium]|nr:DUF3106 domain-containing protein [Phycisphaerae bacterium]
MKRTLAFMLAAVVATGGVAAADRDAPSTPRRHAGDVANQLRLKLKLLRTLGSESAIASLSHARTEWQGLTPDQRQKYRDQARAFLRKNPERQAALLRHYDKLLKMTPERLAAYRYRAAWLKAVTEWLRKHDPERIEALRRMAPADRARQFVALKRRLVTEGEITLPPEPPTATSRPASRPAAEDDGAY